MSIPKTIVAFSGGKDSTARPKMKRGMTYPIVRRQPPRGAELVATAPASELIGRPARKHNPARARKPRWEVSEDLLLDPWSGYEGFVVRTVLLRAKEYAKARKSAPSIRSASEVAHVCRWLQNEPTEHVVLLCMSVGSTLSAVHDLSKGGAHAAAITLEDVAQVMLLTSSSAAVIVHNHPHAEDVTPSKQDLVWTQRVAEGLKCMKLVLLDHVIVAPGDKYYSFVERGLMEQ